MRYLYGDSSESPLTSNFLELLRDALDFSVVALEADATIDAGHASVGALEQKTATETERLEAFVTKVSAAISEAAAGVPGGSTATCSTRWLAAGRAAHDAVAGELRSALAASVAKVNAAEDAQREACLNALEGFLLRHEPPDTAYLTRLDLAPPGHYQASMTGEAEMGLAWTLHLKLPDGEPLATRLRVARLAPQLEIRAPQLSGWITKEVKVLPQKLDKHVVTEITYDGDELGAKLRLEADAAHGFDLEISDSEQTILVSKVGPEGDASVGDFDVHDDDVPKLIQLADKLRTIVKELPRAKLVSATVDGEDFSTVARFRPVVEKLVGAMAPIAREIGERSLTPTELVLRRLLTDNRREEIFVTKAALREKYAGLTEAQRAIFAPLGLEVAARAASPAKPPPPPVSRGQAKKDAREAGAEARPEAPPPPPPPAVRSEIAPSQPPRAPSQAPPPVVVPPAAPPPSIDEAPTLEVSLAPDEKNEVLAITLKAIAALIRDEKHEEAYVEYEALFSDPHFAEYRPEERRQALRLMVLPKAPAPKLEAVVAAHRAAVVQLRALVAASHDPRDHLMLGAALAAVGEVEAARLVFAEGLQIERSRDPNSKLAVALARRVRHG